VAPGLRLGQVRESLLFERFPVRRLVEYRRLGRDQLACPTIEVIEVEVADEDAVDPVHDSFGSYR
jgi:hypothetical protein